MSEPPERNSYFLPPASPPADQKARSWTEGERQPSSKRLIIIHQTERSKTHKKDKINRRGAKNAGTRREKVPKCTNPSHYEERVAGAQTWFQVHRERNNITTAAAAADPMLPLHNISLECDISTAGRICPPLTPTSSLGERRRDIFAILQPNAAMPHMDPVGAAAAVSAESLNYKPGCKSLSGRHDLCDYVRYCGAKNEQDAMAYKLYNPCLNSPFPIFRCTPCNRLPAKRRTGKKE